jgi:hypothetical protein
MTMSENEKAEQNQGQSQQARINRALGVFMLFFGLVILISVFFTKTNIGKFTNLAASAIICLIGGVMVYLSRAKRPHL